MKDLLLKTIRQWWARDPFTQSASAAYYAVFSMPGLLISVVALASLVFDRHTIQTEIIHHMQAVMGRDSSALLEKIIAGTQREDQGGAAMAVGLLTLLFGATGLFVQLQHALNHIWEVEVKKTSSVLRFIRNRATAFGVMISIGFLLMVSLTLTALLGALSDRLLLYVPVYTVVLFHMLDLAVSLGIISLLFALMFRVLPDVRLEWRFALLGGLISALLFKAGEYSLGFYFNLASPESAFGAAGSIVLLMIWVFYSCLILLFGAELTKIYALSRRQHVRPTEIARKV
ncbi:MAG TPA: YihY/virulence factor BrkB family protein [Micavibrio sp.]